MQAQLLDPRHSNNGEKITRDHIVPRTLWVTAIVFMSLWVELPEAQTIRDYYAEPGLNPFKETLGQHFNEQINPFSGGLALTYTDLFIPGNGGLDIAINRIYNSVQADPGAPSAHGLGWTMHMGRIVVSSEHVNKICAQANWQTSGIDNPSLELPDGGREVLFLSNYPNVYLVTRSRWKAECNGANGMIVTSPDGTVYTMSQPGFVGYIDGEYYWYTTRMEDRNGNFLVLDYDTTGGDAQISNITASDGREVNFSYTPAGTGVRLSSISAAGQTWTYNYVSISGLAGSYAHLAEVGRPDGTRWQYDYHPGYTDGTAGAHSLRRVTYPYGASIQYGYGFVNFDPSAVSPAPPTTVVTRKEMSEGGVWTFDYTPGHLFNSALDNTVVHAPNGRYEYSHWGYSGTGNEQQWKIGLLEGREVFGSGGELIEQEVNAWDGQIISNENYWHGRNKIDSVTRAPILASRRLWRDEGANETQYSNYDQYGNPGTRTEIGNFTSDGSSPETRTTNTSYFIDTSRWILNLPDDETIVGVGSILRGRDSNGNLRTEQKFGVLNTYTYTGAGDVLTHTDPRGKVTSYDSYRRGIAQLESHPENVTISRAVNADGTVASETNGRGITKSFGYDSMRRLTSIDFPINADVAVNYSSNTRTLTRGTYRRTDVLDGFGRPVQTTHRDTVLDLSVVTTLEYDLFGNKTFESYPNSPEGTHYDYDVLNRVTRIEHADGSFRTISYRDPAGGRMLVVTDERGHTTKKLEAAYGDPAESYIVKIVSPENLITHIPINKIGQPEQVWQETADGTINYIRNFHYDDRTYLTSRDDPEIGTTFYGRDEAGNMISKTVGTQATVLYTYDDLGRREFIDYPSAWNASDVAYTYDGNNNVRTVANANNTRTYTYDDNDNLDSERLATGGRTFQAQYSIDALDNIRSVLYPSNRLIEYAPDAFGRPTQAAPYVDSVQYHPNGQVSRMVYENGQVVDIDINARQWVERIHSHGTTSIVDLNYGYDPGGNIESIDDGLDVSRSLALAYDGLDRLTSASGPWGSGSLSYDEFGNITQKVIGDETLSYVYSNMRLTNVFRNGASTGYIGYDAWGNIDAWEDPFDPFIPDFLYFYNPAGELHTVNRDGSFYRYQYDGNHHMVKSTVGGMDTIHLYSRGGDLLGDYQTNGTWKNEYVYLGSKLVAQVENTPPVALTNAVTGVFEGAVGQLDGTASHAYGGTITSYAWVQVSGPAVAIQDANTASASFTAPEISETTLLAFSLTITDDQGMSASTEVTVAVWDSVPPPQVDNVEVQQGMGENRIAWTSVPQAESYTLYWSTSPGVVPGSANSVSGLTGPVFLHTGLTDGQTYYYVVVGSNAFGESVDYQEFAVTPGMNGWAQPYRLDQIAAPVEDKPISDLKIVEHPSGKLLAIWAQDLSTSWNNRARYLYASWYEKATGWSAPVEISAGVEGEVFSVAVDQLTGRVVVAWAFGGVNVVQHDPASGWGRPYSTESTGNPEQLKLSVGSGGRVVVAWIKPGAQGILRTYAMISQLGSDQWSHPVELDYASQIYALSADASGGAVIAYQRSSNSQSFKRYDPGTGQWLTVSGPSTFNYTWDYTSIASNSAGQFIILGSHNTNSGPVSVRYTPGSGWSAPALLVTQNSAVGKKAHLYANGEALVIWQQQSPDNASLYLVHASIERPDTGWQPAIVLGMGGSTSVAGNSAGDGIVSWQSGSTARYAAHYSPGVGWRGPNRIAETVSGPSSLALDGSGNATLVWAPSANGSGGIWTNHYWNLGAGAPMPDATPTCAVIPVNTSASEGQTLNISAYAFDTDGAIAAYEWAQFGGEPLTIQNANEAVASITFPQVAAGTETFSFRMSVTDDAGNSCEAATQVSVTRMRAPYGLQVGPGDGELNLVWEDSNDASYNLYWSTSPGVTIGTANRIGGITQATYTHSGLLDGTTYYYAVTRLNAYGVESLLSQEVSATAMRQLWTDPASVAAGPNYSYVQLAGDAAGGAYGVWQHYSQTTYAQSIKGAEHISGTGWQSEMHVNTLPTGLDASSARYPQVAKNDIGDIAIIWEQYDPDVNNGYSNGHSIWVRRYKSGEGWQPAEPVETEVTHAANAQIAIAASGVIVATWVQYDAADNRQLMVNRYVPGAGWVGAQNVDANPTEAHWSGRPQAAVDQIGNSVVVWERWDESRPYTWVREHVNGSWQAPRRLDLDYGLQHDWYGAFAPSVAMNGDGMAVITWLQSYGEEISIFAAHSSAPGTWSQPVLLEASEEFTYWDHWSTDRPVHVAINSAGRAVMSWQQNSTAYVSWYDPVADTWSSPAQVGGQSELGFPRVDLNDDGQAAIAWAGTWSSDNTYRVFANYYFPATGWTGQRMVSINEATTGNVDLEIGQSGNALVVWPGATSLWSSSLAANDIVPPNTAPTANAGIPQAVSEGSVVVLDGSASTDAEGAISFSWLQAEGPAVALMNADTATPSFTAPNVSVDTPLVFTLTVTDTGGLTASASVTVTVQMLDADSDGMSDLWEQAHFGSSGILSTGDADGDGISNLDEYLQGGNPLDGDVNGDGRLNIVDLLLAQRHVLGIAPLSPSQEAALDLAPLPSGADGVVNLGDVVVLQRRILAAH